MSKQGGVLGPNSLYLSCAQSAKQSGRGIGKGESSAWYFRLHSIRRIKRCFDLVKYDTYLAVNVPDHGYGRADGNHVRVHR